jgi:GT2 family glycosyltransferase
VEITSEENPVISVIVPTIGRPESLRRLLESLAAQTRKVDEVIVADGSNNDETCKVVDDCRWRVLELGVRRVVVHPPNAVRQRQAAIAAASGEFMLLLDDDVVLEADCVEQMIRLLLRDPGIVGVFADFNNQSWPLPTHVWRVYLRYVLRMNEGSWQGRVVGPLLRFGYNPTPKEPMPMEWLGTCNTMIRRAAYDEAGGFSNFFLHRCTMNEDVDLGLKLSKLGQILFCPAARMAHFHAPGGRVSPMNMAEDDLYNRYLVIRCTQGRSALTAFGLVLLYFTIETASNLGGCVRRLRGNGFGSRLVGRLRALGRILWSPVTAS